MAVRTGTQLKDTDMVSVQTAVDTVIATPTVANAQALVSTCASVLQNAKDSRRSVTETAGTHGTSGRNPAADIGQLVDAVRKDALHHLSKGAATSASSWRSLKRTHFGSAAPWPQYKTRPTSD